MEYFLIFDLKGGISNIDLTKRKSVAPNYNNLTWIETVIQSKPRICAEVNFKKMRSGIALT